MKAIGQTAGGDILVEMTEREFKLITGRSARIERYGHRSDINQANLDVSDLAYEFEKARNNRASLKRASDDLRALAQLLDTGIADVDKMVERDPVAEAAE